MIILKNPSHEVVAGVLDDFNRSNGSLGSNWSGPIDPASSTSMEISSNQCRGTASDYYDLYWNVTSFNANQQVIVEVPVKPGNSEVIYLWARVNTPNTSLFDAYYFEINGAGGYALYRVLNGAYSAIVSSSTTFAAGDSFRLSCNGSSIVVSRKPSGGEWATVTSQTNTEVTNAGYLGIGIQGSTARLDNFDGGNL